MCYLCTPLDTAQLGRCFDPPSSLSECFMGPSSSSATTCPSTLFHIFDMVCVRNNATMALPVVWDYIVVGGGLSGSVVSSRLLQYNTSLNILLLEAGNDTRPLTDLLYTNDTNLIGNVDLDWMPVTEPQPGLANATVAIGQGKGLGGSTLINACGWARGAAVDYDEWADAVDDQRWSYDGMLEYFKESEDWWNSSTTADHGVDGSLYVASVASTGRDYPLREPVASGWDELGVEALPYFDGNTGQPIGRGELTEDRRGGRRQISASYYPLDGVTVLVNSLVHKIVFASSTSGTPQASGVQLANGTVYKSKNVISAAGGFRSPQLLMLSGIGPKDQLDAFSIPIVVENSAVGENLIDHMSLYQWWKLSDPDAGYALGSENPLFSEPQFSEGYPIDWSVVTTISNKTGLIAAITADEGTAPDPSTHPLLKSDRAFVETFVIYQAYSAADPVVPLDGSHIYTNMVSFQPTSRGTVKLQSTDPSAQTLIDPNYLATEVDRFVYREAMRQTSRLMLNTTFGASYIASETPPDQFEPVTLDDSDEYLDARVAWKGTTTWHPHGTCAMGSVVDTDFRVKGVGGLYVVDSSVLPVSIGAHLMAPLYAMSEQAAAIISAASTKP